MLEPGAPERSTAPTDDERLVIYHSVDREGSTFSLSPQTRRTLEQRYGSRLVASPRIFVAHAVREDFQRLHGNLARQIVALLTGLDPEIVASLGRVEFIDPVTETAPRSRPAHLG